MLLWQGAKNAFCRLERLVPSTDNQGFPLLNKAIKSGICCRLDLYTFKYRVKLFLNIFPLGTHTCSIKHENKSKKRYIHTLHILSKSFDNLMILIKWCLRNYYKYKNYYCDNSWYILAQRNMSSISMKSFSGNEEKTLELYCSGISWVVMILLAFSWLVPSTDNFLALNNPLPFVRCVSQTIYKKKIIVLAYLL